MRHQWADAMSAWDISPHQARALSVVSGRRGDHAASDRGPRLSEIAERLRIAPRSATEVVDGLEELGLVERVPDPDDRRATCVRLTAKGTTVQREIWAARASTDDAFFGRLDDDERTELTRLLRKLLDRGTQDTLSGAE